MNKRQRRRLWMVYSLLAYGLSDKPDHCAHVAAFYR